MANLVRRCIIDNPTCPHCTNQAEDVLHAGPAEPIGDLGGRLRPPLVRGPPSSNNIVYNIVFSSEKK